MITITVPALPPASQSPNSRAHFMQKHRERKAFMQAVALAALAAGVKDVKMQWVKIDVELYVPVIRRRDSDNMLIRCAKPIGDTLVALGVLADDDSTRLEWGMPRCTTDRDRAPATVIRITQLGEAP